MGHAPSKAATPHSGATLLSKRLLLLQFLVCMHSGNTDSCMQALRRRMGVADDTDASHTYLQWKQASAAHQSRKHAFASHFAAWLGNGEQCDAFTVDADVSAV